jgi:hypothetical protein
VYHPNSEDRKMFFVPGIPVLGPTTADENAQHKGFKNPARSSGADTLSNLDADVL